MEQFTFMNSLGKSITFAYDTDYILKGYDGLTATEIVPITTSGYMQSGNTFIDNKLGVRIIGLAFYTQAPTMASFYEKRRYIEKVFNPTLGEGVLTYNNDFLSKSISAVVSASPTPIEKFSGFQLFNVELIANNPFWYDTNINALKLGGFIGGLTLPFAFNPYITLAQKGAVANININGDVPSPIRVEFRNDSTNPKLTLVNTGEFIKLETEIADGEKVEVNTAYGNKTAIRTNTSGAQSSAYHLVSTDSTFFSLPVGENRITFEGSAGTPEVYVFWRNLYVGV
jgi:phage-related protein